MTKEERTEKRNRDTQELGVLLSHVAKHFGLDDGGADAALRAAITKGYVSQHALECYRAIVRSLGEKHGFR